MHKNKNKTYLFRVTNNTRYCLINPTKKYEMLRRKFQKKHNLRNISHLRNPLLSHTHIMEMEASKTNETRGNNTNIRNPIM